MIFLTVIGASLDFLVLDRIRAQVFQEAQRAATNWLGSFRPGSTPQPIPKTRINLLQLVDSHGRVVAASAAAAGRPALSTMRPQVDDRIQNGTECSARYGCVMLAAVRIPPLETREIWRGEPHYVYAGMTQPPILATHRLELLTAAGILLTAALVAWGNWEVGGRSLIDDLLVLARLRAGDPAAHEPIDIGALVTEEAAAHAGGLPVHVHASRDVNVLGNRIQLIRVFDNLLANARRHAETRVEVTAERVDGQAVVTVTDDGDRHRAAGP